MSQERKDRLMAMAPEAPCEFIRAFEMAYPEARPMGAQLRNEAIEEMKSLGIEPHNYAKMEIHTKGYKEYKRLCSEWEQKREAACDAAWRKQWAEAVMALDDK